VPWEDDPLRNFPDKRDFFYEWYEKLMIEKNANYRIVSGVGDERFKNAEKIILELFPNVLHK
jgi:nicotinamide riboside kinase